MRLHTLTRTFRKNTKFSLPFYKKLNNVFRKNYYYLSSSFFVIVQFIKSGFVFIYDNDCVQKGGEIIITDVPRICVKNSSHEENLDLTPKYSRVPR